jgi:uncharacterized membrane protein
MFLIKFWATWRNFQGSPIDKLSVALIIILALIFLEEKPTVGNISGGAFVVAGVQVTVFVK